MARELSRFPCKKGADPLLGLGKAETRQAVCVGCIVSRSECLILRSAPLQHRTFQPMDHLVNLIPIWRLAQTDEALQPDGS